MLRYLNLILISIIAAFILYFTLSLFYRTSREKRDIVEGTIKVVLKSTEGETMDFWDVVKLGIIDAAKELDVDIEVLAPSHEKQINEQIRIFNSVLEQKPPLIILAASDFKKFAEPMNRADRFNIPTIILDSGVDSNLHKSFIATNNIKAGEKAGLEMKRLLAMNSRKEIAIISHIKDTATAIDREAGVRFVLEDSNIIGSWSCDVEEEKAYNITVELIKNGNLGGIIALNEVASLGVARAIKEYNLKDEVFVVGFDNALQELSYLEEGVIKATVVQRPYNMGYLSIQTAVRYLKGDTVDKFIDTGSILITKDNMFNREYQEILFPFNN